MMLVKFTLKTKCKFIKSNLEKEQLKSKVEEKQQVEQKSVTMNIGNQWGKKNQPKSFL